MRQRPPTDDDLANELVATLVELHATGVKLLDMVTQSKSLHPASLIGLNETVLRVHLAVDRAWQRKLDGER